MKIEQDEAIFEGGVRGGVTLGSPIAIGILNRDYRNWEAVMGPLAVDPAAAHERRLTRPRPGHADLAGGMKYGARDLRDVLERASARESAARVAAGAVCKLLLRECGIEVRSGVLAVGAAVDTTSPRSFAALERVREDSPLRAIDPSAEREMVAAVDAARQAGETLGGSILVGARGVPAGLGSYVSWDRKLDGRIGQALLSVPAVKAVEFGSSIEASRGPGSQAHDEIETGPAAPAAAHEPRGRPRGRRDQRRGRDRRRLHEAHLDARPRPRFGGPRDGRTGARRLRAQRRVRRSGLRRHRWRRCSPSCSPRRCSS